MNCGIFKNGMPYSNMNDMSGTVSLYNNVDKAYEYNIEQTRNIKDIFSIFQL
jgi:hypothetical protein